MADKAIPYSNADENDADQFLHQAKGLVERVSGVPAARVYIVWFSKTLKNWKALLSTDVPDGRYYEVAYNGHAEVAYVDTYVKVDNVAITREAF